MRVVSVCALGALISTNNIITYHQGGCIQCPNSCTRRKISPAKKNATKTFKPKGQPWERQARSQCALTHRIREDGEIFSSEEGRETTSDTTPLASVAGSVRMQPTDSDRSNLSQQAAAQQAELTTFVDALVLQQKAMTIQQKATANTEKILSNLVDQMASINEATQATVAAILARLEAGPAVPQIVVADNKDYSP
ncbi:hypothetical protein BASA61_003821 [Batrachochytrium salamandrivorans]|nr:hypothetical protein BASA61_003821 [Batrachochytrium salamandrivorans]